MAILRKAQCDVCGVEQYERGFGVGWPSWVILQGVILDGVISPMLCEQCRNEAMDFIDGMKTKRLKLRVENEL